jgi:clan AA aspartic protease
MDAVKEQNVGRFSVEVELANDRDLAFAQAGVIRPDQVRRARVRAVVDTGATRLVIPEELAKRLGLEISGTIKVRYADGRIAERPVARYIHLSYGGRDSVYSAVVEPGRESALIGAIVLEDLDFVVDCTSQRLVPRDPDKIISEVE